MAENISTPLEQNINRTGTPLDWPSHVRRCKTSRLSLKAYCKSHGLVYSTFIYQYRKAYPVSTKPRLLPVQIKPTESMQSKHVLCKIELSSSRSVWVYDRGIVSDLLSALL